MLTLLQTTRYTWG